MKRVLQLLFIATLIIIALLGWLISTEQGLRWGYRHAEFYLPSEINIDKVEGRLIGPITISGFQFQQEATLVSARCLVRWVSLTDTHTYMKFIRGKNEAEKEVAYDELRQRGGEQVLTDGVVTELTVSLPTRVKVNGEFRVKGAAPPPNNRTFYVTVEGGGRWIQVDVNERGEFKTRLQAGKYILYVQHSSRQFEAQDLEIPDQSAYTFTLDVD